MPPGRPQRARIVNLLATSPEPVCVCEFTGPWGSASPPSATTSRSRWTRPAPRPRRAGRPGLRQPDRGGRPPTRARRCWTWARAGHRRVVVGRAGRAVGQGLWLTWPRRCWPWPAATPRRPALGTWSGSKGQIQAGPDGGCGHLHLRHQPVGRQAGGVRRDLPGPQAGWPPGRHRRGRRGPPERGGPGRAGSLGGLRRRGAVQGRVRGRVGGGRPCWHLGGLHPPVGDGLHSAIITATRPSPRRPVV
jgi:hypothetical protein